MLISGWNLVALKRTDSVLYQQPLRWASQLVPPPEQRLPIALMALLGVAIWFAGISIAIGLVASIWFFARAQPTLFGRLRALAFGIVVGLGIFYFVNNFANLLLPDSMLVSILGF